MQLQKNEGLSEVHSIMWEINAKLPFAQKGVNYNTYLSLLILAGKSERVHKKLKIIT